MTIPTTSIEGIGLGPVADTAALPPLDGLLAQTAQNTADFKAAVEQFQLAMEDFPVPAAEAPVAKAPVAEAPVAKVPLAEVPVVEMPLAEVPVEGAPRVHVKDLPPLDGLLAQNEQIVADFKATTEKLQRAIKSLPLPGTDAPVAKAPISDTPIAKAPVSDAPVAKAPMVEAPISDAPVAKTPVAEIPVEGLPHVEVKNLPPLDGLLAQNERIVADFEATTEKLQRAIKSLPLPGTEAPVAKAPVVDTPIAKAPIVEPTVAKVPAAEIPVEGMPHVDVKNLPPLDGLLAQNERIVADFEATTEKLQRAIKSLPLPGTDAPIAKTPVTEVPIAKAPVVDTSIAKAQIVEAPIAKVPAAEIPAEGVPHVEVKDLPSLDGMLAQNERIVADFEATTEKLQLAMKGLSLPKVAEPNESVDGADVAAPQALPVVEVVLPVRTEQVVAADGAGAVRSVEAVRPVEAVGSKELIGIAEAVADRVLVSPGLMQGDGEVRVLLKPDVLQGTEIRVVSENGTVTVNFIPATPEVAVLLERNQPMLVQHLATHVPSVRLGVSVGRNVRNRENV